MSSSRFLPAAVLTFGLAASAGLLPAAPVINELMYRPGTGFPENTAGEFLEIHNPDAVAIDISGWAMTSGVPYLFPDGAVIPAGGFLVVASDPAAVEAKYGITGVLGPWQAGSTLSNSGEKVTLSQPDPLTPGKFNSVDSVTYASEGDWAVRTRETEFNGWIWATPADGGDHSMELRNPLLSNDNGQNWSPSTATAGATPGAPNTAFTTNVPPVIKAVKHRPAVPSSTQSVTISCELNDETPAGGLTATLYWRNATSESGNPLTNPWSTTPMNGDGSGAFSAVLPSQADLTIIEWYISATDGTLTRTWPAPSTGPGLADQGQLTNCQYQVDNEIATYTGASPVYRLILTGPENKAYKDTAPGDNSNNKIDRQYNTTLVVSQATEHTVRYRSSIRFRGNSSRTYQFKPLRVSLPGSEPWDGVTDFNLNPKYPWLQFIGMRLFQAAGVRCENAVPVEVRRNGIESTSGSGSAQDFGQWVRMEELNGDFVSNHWPDADKGGLYKKGRPDRFWRTITAPSDPNIFVDGWSKQNNSSANDWSDITGFFTAYQSITVPHFPGSPAGDAGDGAGQNTSSIGNWDGTAFTAGQMATLETIADTDQWARWFAVMTLLQDYETNISNGEDDDYSMYFKPEGTGHRMHLIPHDMDTILGQGDTPHSATSRGLWDMTESGSLFRPLLPLFGNSNAPGNAAFRAKYFTALRELIGSTFAADKNAGSTAPFNTFIENHLSGWVPAATRTTLTDFMADRNVYLLGLINDAAIAPPVPVSTSTLTSPAGAISLSEIMASNVSTLAGDGTYPDWIELHNSTGAAVNLEGLSLTDNPADPAAFVFPAGASIPAGGYLLVYADSAASAGYHTGFALSHGGETLALYDSAANGGALLDSVEFGPQIDDRSIGRTGAGLTTWTLCTPTPSAANAAVTSFAPVSGVRINEWLANPDFRVADDFIELYNPAALPVALGGTVLTDDDINSPARHILPALSYLGAGGFHAFLANGGGSSSASNLPFALDGTAGPVAFLDQNGARIDRVDVVNHARDTSTGLSPDGGTAWTAYTLPTPGLPNASPPAAYSDLLASLRITELLYHPTAAMGADNEFVELKNLSSTATLDLSGVRFTDGIDYTFPPGVTLAPGAFVLVSKNPAAFAALWPAAAAKLAPGAFTGSLSNGGETIALLLPAPWEVAILRFDYQDSWYPLTDTAGHSLAVVDAAITAPRDWNEKATWTASAAPGGTPGTEGPPVITSTLSAGGIYLDPFSYQITASRNPTSFTATGLPPGLLFSAGSGSIIGTPQSSGTWSVNLGATNDDGTASATLVLTVAASGPLDHFTWDTAPASAQSGQGFPVHATARDSKERIVTSFSGTTSLNAAFGIPSTDTIVVSEATDVNPDRFEITNVTDRTLNTAGWKIYLGHNRQPIESYAPTQWSFPATITPGQVLWIDDGSGSPAAPNYFGMDFFWQGGSSAWVLIVDQNGQPVDFVAWGFSNAELDSGTLPLPTGSLTVRDLWTGPSLPANTATSAWRRKGTADHNDASDWDLVPSGFTFGTANPELTLPWQSATPLPLSASTLTFTSGHAWTVLAVTGTATGAFLTTADTSGHSARSAAFDVTAFPDTDGDGLPDAWESANGFNPAVADSSGDPDHDGYTTLQEYQLGTNPRAYASRLSLEVTRNEPAGTLTLTWPAIAGHLYQGNASTDLTTWSPLPGTASLPATTGPATLTIPGDSATRLFLRISAPQP